ncbi:MAG TPA: hypothetical protein PKD24_05330 [Pyrinomonadaceae bacterium]|nr:hypothetical protein [Pyrinomonadaceae bacterium]HMP64973.1 hypothetical protein [Pyrinomonadaceae bacterium]
MRSLFFTLLILSFLASCSAVYAQTKQPDERTLFSQSVTDLPAVDKVEIFAVEGIRTNRKDIDCTQPDIVCSMISGKILASKTLSGEDANKIADLWRDLRNGNGAACFAAAYVLRFYQNDKLLLVTDVCFHCCNVTLPGTGIRSICGDREAFVSFKDLVTTELPFPKLETKEPDLR